MKKIVKQFIVSILTVVIVLSAAPLSGFVGLYLNWLDLSTKTAAEEGENELASTGQCGKNVYWTFDKDIGLLTISGSGEMYNYSWKSSYLSPFYNNKDIKKIIVEQGVTYIGNYSFFCVGAQSIIMFEGLVNIGESAFSGCDGLTSISIPDSVETIGDSAFESLNNVMYNGTADGAPWGAKSINGYIEDGFVYNNDSKEAVLGCSIYKSGEINISNGVKTIGKSAFHDCKAITSVNLPESVKVISESAFSSCSNLKNVMLSEGIERINEYAFYNCTLLMSVNIPDSVTSIGVSAFEDCTNLISINVPDSITDIGEYAFKYVNNIVYNGPSPEQWWGEKVLNGYVEDGIVYSDASKKSIDGCISSKSGKISIPNGIESIGWSAFRNCAKLSDIIISDSVTEISSRAFEGCRGLTQITIPSSVAYIQEHTFNECTELTNIYIQSGVTTIGDYAFSHCSSLSNIIIPDSVTSLGTYPFLGCINLKEVVFGNGLTDIEDALVLAGDNLTNVFIGDSVEKISGFGFRDCKKLENVNIGNGVESICEKAFYGCINLEKIDIPYNVKSIGPEAFLKCNKLTSITIYNRACNLGENLFTKKTTIYGYAGSTAEIYADDNGIQFIPIDNTHKHLYNNENKMCILCGFDRSSCSHDEKSWHIVKNPTLISEGLMEETCDLCNAKFNEMVIPMLVPDYVTGISLSHDKLALNIGETATITAKVNPDTAKNKNIIWSSTDADVATVDNGVITAKSPGMTVISAETEDNGFVKFCVVRVASLIAVNGSVVDNEKGIIYGIGSNSSDINSYVRLVDSTMIVQCESTYLGTGSTVNVLKSGKTVDSFKVIVFGDVNGDSWYDGTDAVLVNMIANGMLTREQIGEAVWLAADCNHDGVINQADVDLLNKAGLLLSSVDQTKSSKELFETSSEYVEYLGLIDQNKDVKSTPEQDNSEAQKTNMLEAIIAFIWALIKRIVMVFK